MHAVHKTRHLVSPLRWHVHTHYLLIFIIAYTDKTIFFVYFEHYYYRKIPHHDRPLKNIKCFGILLVRFIGIPLWNSRLVRIEIRQYSKDSSWMKIFLVSICTIYALYSRLVVLRSMRSRTTFPNLCQRQTSHRHIHR